MLARKRLTKLHNDVCLARIWTKTGREAPRVARKTDLGFLTALGGDRSAVNSGGRIRRSTLRQQWSASANRGVWRLPGPVVVSLVLQTPDF